MTLCLTAEAILPSSCMTEHRWSVRLRSQNIILGRYESRLGAELLRSPPKNDTAVLTDIKWLLKCNKALLKNDTTKWKNDGSELFSHTSIYLNDDGSELFHHNSAPKFHTSVLLHVGSERLRYALPMNNHPKVITMRCSYRKVPEWRIEKWCGTLHF